MRKFCMFFMIFMMWAQVQAASPIRGLLERIVPGSSDKFVIEQESGSDDFFELDRQGNKVVVRGNNYVSIATGINWYLKYYAHVHLSWNDMQVKLPETLPIVYRKERHETGLNNRYYLNYCTLSYSMAFWNWNRWEREIDWMALHGIDLSLMTVGTDVVWYTLLSKLGYTESEIGKFIAGPGFQAWWLMNNLEGWGGPNSDNWYRGRLDLARRILKRMHEYGIEPVLPGYSGMLPDNARVKLGVDVSNPGMWCGFRRPAFLQPTDPKFSKIADLYYRTMDKLLGKADYYSMDPFHEGGNIKGVNLEMAGLSIMKAMKKNNPRAVWVIQAWQANPRREMIDHLKSDDMLVLDLCSEDRPQWGDPLSEWYRKGGFGHHKWIYCMIENYGGNTGLYGKMDHVIDEFYKAKSSSFSGTLSGIGMTMEGIENNPVMFELLSELPWRNTCFKKEDWLSGYVRARYGKSDSIVRRAWSLLSNSIYNCPARSTQGGTTQSVFCARPTEEFKSVSTWSDSNVYYDADSITRAARLMLSVSDLYKGNNNFEYDLVDILRQALDEKGRFIYLEIMSAYRTGDRYAFDLMTRKFLRLIDLDDELLSTRSDFMVGRWIDSARQMGTTPEEKALYERNARVQITTWGNRVAANEGGLRDYAYKEWNGILKDLYKERWSVFFRYLSDKMNHKKVEDIDFYSLEEAWTKGHKSYPYIPQGDVIATAKKVFSEAGF